MNIAHEIMQNKQFVISSQADDEYDFENEMMTLKHFTQ